MATMTITIPDEYVATLLEAFDTRYPGREGEGMTKAQWARWWIRREIRDTYRLYGMIEGEALKEGQMTLRDGESETFQVV